MESGPVRHQSPPTQRPRPTGRRVGQVLLLATLVAAVVVLLDAFFLADATGISSLRRAVVVGVGVGLIALVTDMVTVPPAALIGFGVVALAVYAIGAVMAPPQGLEWLAFLVMVAFPAGLIAWGMALRGRHRQSG
jgi:hypothetical protein